MTIIFPNQAYPPKHQHSGENISPPAMNPSYAFPAGQGEQAFNHNWPSSHLNVAKLLSGAGLSMEWNNGEETDFGYLGFSFMLR